ncbi:MAG: MFS transporter [Promethearchaeota archaeon]
MKITHARLIRLIEKNNTFLENLDYQIGKDYRFEKKIPIFKNILQDNVWFKSLRKNTFCLIFGLYLMIYFSMGILPANIDELLVNLQGTSSFGIGLLITINLLISMASIIFFGYYTNYLAKKITRKKLFVFTNFIWILSYGLLSISLNFTMLCIFLIISAIGTGAFLPIGFSMIGDFYSSQERGTKFGLMQFGYLLGNGLGIIIGGFIGWRMGFMLGAIIGIIMLIAYFLHGIDSEYKIVRRVDPKELKAYNYKITGSDVLDLFKIKSVSAILISVFCSGLAIFTLGNWAIFYLTNKVNNEIWATFLYIFAGLGALPGSIIGGKLGDKYYYIFHNRGRMIVSFLGLLIGISFLIGFYIHPLLLSGIIGYFFTYFAIGNQFAIYTEVCIPKFRSTVNGLNSLMLNLGGIIGNLVLSALIQHNIVMLDVYIIVVLSFWLLGSFMWIILYFYYPYESERVKIKLLPYAQVLQPINFSIKLKKKNKI